MASEQQATTALQQEGRPSGEQAQQPRAAAYAEPQQWREKKRAVASSPGVPANLPEAELPHATSAPVEPPDARAGPTPTRTYAEAAYAVPAYWDARYQAQPLDFEWFYGYVALRRILRTYLPKQKPILQVGCGNSNVQQGMAENNWLVTNIDISSVVIAQMRERHAHITGLEYLIADCRDMNMFTACHFHGAFDKGTIDALMCCKEGTANVKAMCTELCRVLRPGTTFLAITLGEPSQRLPLLVQSCFDWTVSVLLLPRLPPEKMVQAQGRALPVNDSLAPVKPLGPFSVRPDLTVEGLPQPWDASQYFYVYACTKARIELQVSNKMRHHLPESWCIATRETVARLQAETGSDLFSRGIRTRRVHRAEFLAQQRSVGLDTMTTSSTMEGQRSGQRAPARSRSHGEGRPHWQQATHAHEEPTIPESNLSPAHNDRHCTPSGRARSADGRGAPQVVGGSHVEEEEQRDEEEGESTSASTLYGCSEAEALALGLHLSLATLGSRHSGSSSQVVIGPSSSRQSHEVQPEKTRAGPGEGLH